MEMRMKTPRKRFWVPMLVLCSLVVFGARIGITEGTSMEPTFSNHGLNLTVRAFTVRPGDVVVAIDPEAYKWPKDWQYLCKRVVWVTEDEVFLQGDNTEESYDSRHFGPVPRKDVLYRVVAHLNI